MIKAKHDGRYKQVGFIKLRQPDGTYKDVEKKYGKINGGYGLVFEKGFTRETEGALPLQIDGIGKPLKDYDIEGNTYQSDGVSPDTPQEVKGCGERTGNLAYNKIETANVGPNGTIIRASEYDVAIARIEIGKVYTVDSYVLAFYTDEPVAGSVSYDGSRIVETMGQPTTFTAPITGYVAFRINLGEQSMLNSGSTPLPYEPYGYKVDVECRGKNLFDGEYEAGNILPSTGELQESSQRYRATNFIPVMPNTTYTFSKSSGTGFFWVTGYKDDFTGVEDGDSSYPASLLSAGDDNGKTVVIFTTTPTTRYVKWYTTSKSGVPTQLELGTEATSYSPYTPPITTPIYLDSPLYKIGDYADRRGMTEEVRAVKELVLTGEEDWALPTANTFRLTINGYLRELKLICICTHYKAVENIEYLGSQFSDKSITFLVSTSGNNYCYIRDSSIPDTTAWKSYLATQYTAGTPVTVYYVLATPEIKAVEPVEIPTIQGTNINDINTEVKPSNMWVEYKSSK